VVDSGERLKKLLWPLEGADPDDPSVPHVTVSCANCPTHLFVAKDDPRLPDGPFFCLDHMDTPPDLSKLGDRYSEADLICDRCGVAITTRGQNREDAIAKLDALGVEKRWRRSSSDSPEDLCPSCQN
jgi:hypothetical protein